MKILSPQPGTFIDDSARNNWGWDPQYDLAATTLEFLDITTCDNQTSYGFALINSVSIQFLI